MMTLKLNFQIALLKKTNSKIGENITLLKSSKNKLTVLDIDVGIIKGSVGSLVIPNITAKGDIKKWNIGTKIAGGFNTFKGDVGGELFTIFGFKIKAGIKGYLGGVSGNFGIGSTKQKPLYFELGGSLGLGGGVYFDVAR